MTITKQNQQQYSRAFNAFTHSEIMQSFFIVFLLCISLEFQIVNSASTAKVLAKNRNITLSAKNITTFTTTTTTSTTTTRPTTTNTTKATTTLKPASTTINSNFSLTNSSLSRSAIATEAIALALPRNPTSSTNSKTNRPHKNGSYVENNGENNSNKRNLASYVSSTATTNNNSALSYYNYPFHQYALPECATQQVCNAVYTRLDRINALCACPEKFGDPCSISFSSDDAHTIELVTDSSGKALTLIKTCEPIATVRECRGSKDWALLALQNVRTGKSHYLVVCRCVQQGVLEGPIAHENPPYAKIPGIRVFGMICIRDFWRNRDRGSRSPRDIRAKKLSIRRNLPKIPWNLVNDFLHGDNWN